ncbi:MAG: sigma-70 family RNA polymerase sigma factor [Kiritimatiellaeota bacterium]|nr:sigma-70 family RNA polymerase sigma factor [Kiritimatiellota bacterium]
MNEQNETTPPPAEVPDEGELLQRARRRDRAAGDELVRRYHGRIYNLLYHMTASREDAEDLTQDVFVKAFAALHRFRGGSSFYTWLYRIAINHGINFLKKRGRRETLSLDNLDQAIERDPFYVELRARESPVREASLAELQNKLNVALQQLSDKHRTVVVLHDIQGLPHPEIASMLKTSEGTVRSRLFYARRQLQQALKEFAP